MPIQSRLHAAELPDHMQDVPIEDVRCTTSRTPSVPLGVRVHASVRLALQPSLRIARWVPSRAVAGGHAYHREGGRTGRGGVGRGRGGGREGAGRGECGAAPRRVRHPPRPLFALHSAGAATSSTIAPTGAAAAPPPTIRRASIATREHPPRHAATRATPCGHAAMRAPRHAAMRATRR